ncbi:MAG: P-II family nitrogen regulator [Candidatus Omnitrophica bacterium]|nr:P-II family nitrogen regulator [Candidatus Omnitrophota bacterium]
MKEIVAIIRPQRDRATKEELVKIGCLTCTTFRVYGRGKQRGLTYKSALGNGSAPVGMKYLPKKMVYLMVNDQQVKPIVQAILRANQTSQYGDGKIFVTDSKEVVRIRTGERGEVAIR